MVQSKWVARLRRYCRYSAIIPGIDHGAPGEEGYFILEVLNRRSTWPGEGSGPARFVQLVTDPERGTPRVDAVARLDIINLSLEKKTVHEVPVGHTAEDDAYPMLIRVDCARAPQNGIPIEVGSCPNAEREAPVEQVHAHPSLKIETITFVIRHMASFRYPTLQARFSPNP